MFGSNKAIGLDVSDTTIEVIEIQKKGSRDFEALSLGRVELEPGVVEYGRIENEEKLKKAVFRVFNRAKPNPIEPVNVIFGLPESQVYTHFFYLKEQDKDKKREEAIMAQLIKHVPLNKDDVVYTYKQFQAKDQDQAVLVLAASRAVVSQWRNFFAKIGLRMERFDIETLAAFRPLYQKSISEPVCVVDMGAKSTSIAVFDHHGLFYSHIFNRAGHHITRAIADKLNLSIVEAEKMKKKQGLTPENKKLFKSISPILDKLAEEIVAVVGFFENKTGDKVNEVVLIGGSSEMKNVDLYLEKNIGMSIKIGHVKTLRQNVERVYIGAVGLAMRFLDKRWEKTDPMIEYREKKKKKFKKFINKIVKAKQRGQGAEKSGVKSDEAESPEQINGVDKTIDFSPVNDAAKKKPRRQLVILGIVVISGLIIIAAIYFYRSARETTWLEQARQSAPQFTQIQTFNLQIPVAVERAQYSSDRGQGRIITDTIEMAGTYAEALAVSRVNVSRKLRDAEAFWREPLNKMEIQREVEFPLRFKWFVYNRESTDQLFVEKFDRLNEQNVEYLINDIKESAVRATSNEDVYYLSAEITVALSRKLNIDSNAGMIVAETETDERTTLFERDADASTSTFTATDTAPFVTSSQTTGL